MKAIILENKYKEITISLDDEAIEDLIKKLQKFKREKSQTSIKLQKTSSSLNLAFIPFDIQDKRIREFYKDKEELESKRKINQ